MRYAVLALFLVAACGTVTQVDPDAQPPPDAFVCTTASQCDDEDDCTDNVCNASGACEFPPIDLAPGSITFTYQGAPQDFVVPACVTSVTVVAFGAAGGTGEAAGGLGGSATATMPVTPGETLGVYVGGAGPTATNGTADVETPGGFNGGGGAVSCCGAGASGTGGGASDVRRGVALADRLIVAGGGGGGGFGTTTGGDGGGETGGNGVDNDATRVGGDGGTQTAGGAPGLLEGAPNYPNEPGALGTGGRCWYDSWGCGAGGGGYYGGGGGCFSGGGGGSSFVAAPGNTATSTTAGVRAGHGEVTISWD